LVLNFVNVSSPLSIRRRRQIQPPKLCGFWSLRRWTLFFNSCNDIKFCLQTFFSYNSGDVWYRKY